MNNLRDPTAGLPASGTDAVASPGADDDGRLLVAEARRALDRLAEGVGRFTRGGADAARRRAVSLRDSSRDAIRERPLQAVLIAAGVAALIVLLARGGRRGG